MNHLIVRPWQRWAAGFMLGVLTELIRHRMDWEWWTGFPILISLAAIWSFFVRTRRAS